MESKWRPQARRTSSSMARAARETARITAGILQIGQTVFGGQITVSAPINVANNTTPIPTLHLLSRGAVVDANASGTDLTAANLVLEGFSGGSTTTTLTTNANNLAVS